MPVRLLTLFLLLSIPALAYLVIGTPLLIPSWRLEIYILLTFVIGISVPALIGLLLIGLRLLHGPRRDGKILN